MKAFTQKSDRLFYSVSSPQFDEMIEKIHSYAKTYNPRKLCLECWSVETRTTTNYEVHIGHDQKTTAEYSGTTVKETKLLIIGLAKEAKAGAFKEELVMEIFINDCNYGRKKKKSYKEMKQLDQHEESKANINAPGPLTNTTSVQMSNIPLRDPVHGQTHITTYKSFSNSRL